MLKTIRAHKNLHYLTDRLPKSNYQNGHEYEKVPALSQSTKTKPQQHPQLLHQNRNINLPKLDRIIVRNNAGNYKSPGMYHQPSYHERVEKERKGMNLDVGNLLKIEGKGSNPRYEYHEPKKVVEKDLKAELRRIYNLKPSPPKHAELKPLKRNVRELPGLPRIN